MNRTPRFPRLPRTSRAAEEDNPRFMKAGMAGLATTLLVWGGLGLAGLGLAERFAQADPGGCPSGKSCMRWCPGDPDPAGRPIPWDASVCHDYFWDYAGVHDIGTGTFYSWSSVPFKKPPPPGPVPTQTSYLPLPTLPFCPVPPWCP